MNNETRIQCYSYTEYLKSLVDEPMHRYMPKRSLIEKLVPLLSTIQGKDIHYLKHISPQIKNLKDTRRDARFVNIDLGKRESDESIISSQLDALTDCFDRHQTVYETLLFFHQYPLELIDQIVQWTALALLAQQIKHLANNTLRYKKVVETEKIIPQLSFRPRKSHEIKLKQGRELESCRTISEKKALALVYLACKSRSYIKELSLPIYIGFNEIISLILKECPEIEKLNLCEWGCDYFVSPMEAICHLKNLKSLKLPPLSCVDNGFAPFLPMLEFLSLDCNQMINIPLFSQCRGLKEVHLTVSEEILLSILKHNMGNFDNLDTLKLEFIGVSIYDVYLEVLSEIAKLPALKNLSIIQADDFTNRWDKDILHILSTFSGLERLHLDFNVIHDLDTLEALLRSLPTLKHIYMESYNGNLDLQQLADKYPNVDIEYEPYS